MGRCHSKLPQVGKPLRPQQKDLLKSYRIIFVMGGPGCGKGTQCENMAAKYGFCHVGLGELLREEANQATVRGQLIRDIMLKGLLVPTGVILDMVSDNMLSRPNSKGFLIDGFPRELSQAKEFERIVGRSPNIVIVFDCSTETMIHRVLLRGQEEHREDDAEDIVRQRLETHYTLCEPILAFYQQKNLLRNILAEDAAENIFAKCCSVIDSLQ
ncbi:adenylate kinase isoenzyme 1-like isoform X1 [Antechinus flavipes]|uniref:adenylate kinase isoenzyme 1-like isoform X1 n=1 Tax=Antechinus flavipes TaxID=38775 RepID=UPI0022360A04|nr:adenylate kinase isoenzyme 1-like isoform X1 [Antechinus flavipes]XP_051827723.1 adenylate kinase isoenzyme 1-like isoform X1 [Antechinus flavipes]XP_051827724.1 adenylate kinase isoenzyme 1-like isoform X1 [Antechinus flavipes]